VSNDACSVHFPASYPFVSPNPMWPYSLRAVPREKPFHLAALEHSPLPFECFLNDSGEVLAVSLRHMPKSLNLINNLPIIR